jgi:hypothetical protein
VPPLSIAESRLLLSEARDALIKNGLNPAAPDAAQERWIDRVLETVGAYVERVDRANPTLPYYRWHFVATERVPPAGWKAQSFKLKDPIDEVTALAVWARHGDLEIESIAAIEKDRTRWEFGQPLSLLADQPHPEICYLPLPARLAEVRVACRPTDPGARRPARLLIHAGVCSISESAKQAGHHLEQARADLKAQRRESASRHIEQARLLLKEYQKSRRL